MIGSNYNLGSVGHSFPINFLNSSHDEGFNLGVILVDDVLRRLGFHTKVLSPLTTKGLMELLVKTRVYLDNSGMEIVGWLVLLV